MRASYDVVVIGGGIMGLAIATRLRRLGAGTVALLERRFLGAGESGKSGAILRQHYSHAVTIRMARDSLREFADFERQTGHDIGFTRSGMLFLVPDAERAGLEANVRLQQSEGVVTSVLDSTSLRDLVPEAETEGVVAAWEPDAAFVDPILTLGAFGAEANRAGVEIQLGCEVRGLRCTGSRVHGVDTSTGPIAAGMVVAATGPWSARLLEGIGAALPLEVVRPQQAFLGPPVAPGSRHPIVADLPHEVYYKPESRWTRVGSISYDQDERVTDPDVYEEGVAADFLQDARRRVARRFPAYGHAVIWGGGSGLYTVTPDAHAVIGAIPGWEGFVLVTGFSGHGFKLAPSVGQGVAESIVHGACRAFDLAFFDPARFADSPKIATAYRFKILG